MIDKFTPDQPYFYFSYYDKSSLVPHITTLVYLGTEIEFNGTMYNEEGMFYFQDASSFVYRGRLGDNTTALENVDNDEEISVKAFSHNEISLVLGYQELIEELSKINSTRKLQ